MGPQRSSRRAALRAPVQETRCSSLARSAVLSRWRRQTSPLRSCPACSASSSPTWPASPITPVDPDGWDNSSFRIGADYTARLPSDDGYVPAGAKEHQWLPVLGPRLPVPIPEPVALGAPGCGFPRPWSVYRWLPGDSACADLVTDLDALARDVAQFLTALWAVDSRSGPTAGAHSFGRGGPLSVYDADVHACLDALPADITRGPVLDRWQAAVSAPFEAEPCWFHGDMAPSNLLVRDGRLVAARESRAIHHRAGLEVTVGERPECPVVPPTGS